MLSNSYKRYLPLDKSQLPSVSDYCFQRGWTLSGSGQWRTMRCPIHTEQHPSFSIQMSSGAFKCHACDAKGGDLIALHQQVYNVSFVQACQDLGDAAYCSLW